MRQNKKLNLKELELQLPSIDSDETKIIIGGDSYGHHAAGSFDMWYWGGNGNSSDHDDDDGRSQGQDADQGDLDHYFDNYDGHQLSGDWGYDANGHSTTGGTTTESTHTYEVNNLPTMDKQTSNECWYEAAEYIYKFLNPNYTASDVNNYDQHLLQTVANITGGGLYDALHNGLDNSYFDQFVNSIFEATKITSDLQVFQSLQDGNLIYAVADSVSNPAIAWDHIVIIVGYEYSNVDNCFYFHCADSATGSINLYSSSDLNFNLMYSITGLK